MDAKLHSKEELQKCFLARLKEELLDVDTYNNLYESLIADGLFEEAEDIEDIANDEFTHARVLWEILEDWGYPLHENTELITLFHKAKMCFAD